jgi:hypothetical protein
MNVADRSINGLSVITKRVPRIRVDFIVRDILYLVSTIGASPHQDKATSHSVRRRRGVTAWIGQWLSGNPRIGRDDVFIVTGNVVPPFPLGLLPAQKKVSLIAVAVVGSDKTNVIPLVRNGSLFDPTILRIAQRIHPRRIVVLGVIVLEFAHATAGKNERMGRRVVHHAATGATTIGQRREIGPLLSRWFGNVEHITCIRGGTVTATHIAAAHVKLGATHHDKTAVRDAQRYRVVVQILPRRRRRRRRSHVQVARRGCRKAPAAAVPRHEQKLVPHHATLRFGGANGIGRIARQPVVARQLYLSSTTTKQQQQKQGVSVSGRRQSFM